MPIFKPFRGVRPHLDYIDRFPTITLDNFSPDQILEKSNVNSSYIQMVKPYVVSKSKDVDRNLRKIRHSYEELLEEKKLIQDPSSYYLYVQILPDKTVFRGLLGLVSVEDFFNGKIKKHESTITARKEKLAQYIEKVKLQAEPVLLTYNSNSKVELLMNHEEKNIPVINYLAENGIRHKLWKIDNRLKLQQFKEVIDKEETFYIADGHHRIGSVALNAKKQKEKNKKHTGTESYNYVYSYIVSNHSIKINDYNRLLQDLNGLSSKAFLKQLEKSFMIHDKGEVPYFPSQKFHFSMYLDGKFYSLHVKHDIRMSQKDNNDMDHFLLEELVFHEILGIDDPKTTEKITYLKGNGTIEGIVNLKTMVDSGEYKVGFGIYPISFSDLTRICNHNIKMPPKCTNIDPKVVTALVVYDME